MADIGALTHGGVFLLRARGPLGSTFKPFPRQRLGQRCVGGAELARVQALLVRPQIMVAVKGHPHLDGAITPEAVGDLRIAGGANTASQRRQPFGFQRIGSLLLLRNAVNKNDSRHEGGTCSKSLK
jgi:hypothetical protein